MPSQPPRVFISYSHDSELHSKRVLALANQLRGHGIEARIDQYVGDPDEGWPMWMRNQVLEADRVLLVFTETYARRFLGKEVEGSGLGVTFEGFVATQAFRAELETRSFDRWCLLRRMRGLFRWSCGASTVIASTPSTSTKSCFGGCMRRHGLLYRQLVRSRTPPELLPSKPEEPRDPTASPFPKGPLGAAGLKEALSNLPDRNRFFTGREPVLAQLQEVRAAQGRAVLSGLGGVGKTQTVVEYAHRHSAEYAQAFWSPAGSREAVGSGYATIVSILGLPEAGAQDRTLAVGAAQRWFSSNENWLLILDNADDLTMAREFIPPGNNGHVLLTARWRASGTVAPRLDIEEMGTEALVSCLGSLSRISRDQAI